MKTKKFLVVNLLLLGIFLLIFFFKIIPVPVENIEGANDPNKFIYGGIYWTSGLYQLSVGNFQGILGLFCIFIPSLALNNYLWIKNEKKNKI